MFGRGYGNCGFFGDGFGYGMFGGWMQLIFLILIGALIFYLIRGISRKPHKIESSEAVEIIKSRFARGEINEEEYKKMMEAIKRD